MKKWSLVIFPAVMFAIFFGAYMSAKKQWAAKEQAHLTQEAEVKKEKDAKDAVMRAKAAEEAKKKADDRAEAAKKKEDERLAKWNKEGQDVDNETKRAQTAADEAQKQINQMESQLAKLREAREKGNRDYLDSLKRVQTAEIDRRTAELEISRLTTIIDRRAVEESQKRYSPPTASKGTN